MNGKKPRLFYYEDAENCWAPADGLNVDDIICADTLMDGMILEIQFKRIDMTDEEFANIPEG